MQLVLSGNRVLAHGEDCFLCMGGTVVCNDTGKVYQNATIAECDSCPSDIDTVGYEYHAGVFVPCAPYGTGHGNVMVACEDCATPKDSGVPSNNLGAVVEGAVVLHYDNGKKLPAGGYWSDVCSGGGAFVAVSSGSNVAAYSTDGETWIATTLPASASWVAVAYGNGTFVAVASGLSYPAYSTDGITWTAGDMYDGYGTFGYDWCDIVYGKSKFVAISKSNSFFVSSTDGITWSTSGYIGTLTSRSSIAFGNGVFVVLDDAADTISKFAYSTDGISFTVANMPVVAPWSDVVYTNGMFFAVADKTSSQAAKAAISTDGTTWTSSTVPVNNTDLSLGACTEFTSNPIVVVGKNATKSAVTYDGETWEETTIPQAGWVAVAHNGTKFVAISNLQHVVESEYGSPWKGMGHSLKAPDGTDVTENVKYALGI